MYRNTSKATDTRVFRMPDKREPILAKIYNFALHMAHSKYILLMRTSSMLFGAIHFASFLFPFCFCCVSFCFNFISFHYYYYYLFVVDERVALSS